ncbi:MAG: class I SAM-dependent methyltransferase [Nitrospira sp.]|nr:class I SAM-dependent methyltransferase [Nitrospira sp.]
MERRAAYPTDTQHVVNLSGYVWAARQLDAAHPHRILDLSCGTGYGADYLGPCADTIVAIDCVQAVAAKSRSDYPRPNVHFLAMDGCALGFRDESFDCIVSQDTIEHIQDDGRFVAELTRVLKLHGTLIIFTPHGKGKGVKPSDPYHIREYTAQEFMDLLAPHFSTIRWYGRRQGHRLRTAEQSMDTIRTWDPLGLRTCVPRPVRHWIGSLISRLHGGPDLGDLVPADIEYTEGIAQDTNLIGVCVK